MFHSLAAIWVSMALECGSEAAELSTWVEMPRLSFVFAEGDQVLLAQDGGEILEGKMSINASFCCYINFNQR